MLLLFLWLTMQFAFGLLVPLVENPYEGSDAYLTIKMINSRPEKVEIFLIRNTI